MKKLYGLVVCGGKSSRMGKDKGLLQYYGSPQRYHLYHQLESYCDKVFISCNSQQSKNIEPGFNILIDKEEYSDIGPMGALLSAHNDYPEASFFVVGCDYPFLNENDLKKLTDGRLYGFDVVCFFNPETSIEEPLLAIYENECLAGIVESFNKSNYSLRHFLKSKNVNRVIPDSIQSITSVDTESQFRETLLKLKDKA